MGEMIRRRTFLGAGAAAIGGAAFGNVGACVGRRRLLRFGVASDVHVSDVPGRAPEQLFFLEKTLRWFDRQGVEAVIFPGDLIDTGLISEYEKVAAVWNKVFPSGRGSDGRPVEHVIVTGNHEIAVWPGRWKGISEEEQGRIRFDRHEDETMRRLFGEPYEPVFMRTIKGVAFVAAQYHTSRPPVAAFLAAHAGEIPPDRPFFYVQHAHPQQTCYGDEAREAWDGGLAVKALSRFPMAVALTGHSHNPLTDGRSVWQGMFTSIGCGCLLGAGSLYHNYDNSLAGYFKEYAAHRMARVHGTAEYNAGRGCLLIDVFHDGIACRRWSPFFDEDLGPDWVVPVPASQDGPFKFTGRSTAGKPLKFAESAKVSVRVCENAPQKIGPRLKGRQCVSVRFPAAVGNGGNRVFGYDVSAAVDGKEVVRSRIISTGHGLPPSRLAGIEEECLFGRDELPTGAKVVFTVIPHDCYGTIGESLVSGSVELA